MAQTIEIKSNYPIWSRAMLLFRRKMLSGVKAANRDTAEEMLLVMREHVSGRPGPEVETGAFKSSLFVEVDESGFGFIAGSTAPQARRLELGFVGVDSLGRHYMQPAYPWLEPSAEEIWPTYKARMQKAIHGEYS